MNEKEKMIEEMKQILIDWAISKDLCFSFEVMQKHAEVLYNAGYRKIPEGAVVLTSEQYSDYLILKTKHEWLKHKANELQADNERLYKNLGKFKESVRKETAKEIIEIIKEADGADLNYIAEKYGVKVEE